METSNAGVQYCTVGVSVCVSERPIAESGADTGPDEGAPARRARQRTSSSQTDMCAAASRDTSTCGDGRIYNVAGVHVVRVPAMLELDLR